MKYILNSAKFKGFGVYSVKEGLYVSVSAVRGRDFGIILYFNNEENRISFSESTYHTGDVYCMLIKGLPDNGLGMQYKFYYDKTEYLDEYVRSISGLETYGKKVSKESLKGNITKDYVSCESKPLMHPFADSFIYQLSVRGFTKSDKVSNSGTFEALEKKVPYFTDLGVTALELMPISEYSENLADSQVSSDIAEYSKNTKKDIINYWGFAPSYHFAIKKSLSSCNDPNKSFEHFVKCLHKNNIECILQMYYTKNHTKDYITDSLIYLISRFGVDGFRLLGEDIPVNEIINNPFMSQTKIITDNTYINYLPSKKSSFKNVAFCLDENMLDLRKFLKGDEDMVDKISRIIRSVSEETVLINNITDYYGFTLTDLVSYNRKHNEANNENNTDGTSRNYSWNCGFEGETTQKAVLYLRRKQLRNAMLLTVLNQGATLIKAGDEWLNSQDGNNNPYCQDNPIGWTTIQKNKTSRDFYNFCKNLIAFKKRHTILHQDTCLKLNDYKSFGIPDISYHGEEPWRMNTDNYSREFAVLYAGAYKSSNKAENEDSIYIVYNMHWENRIFSLPIIADNAQWKLLYSSDGSTDESFDEEKAVPYANNKYEAKGRSITVFLLSVIKGNNLRKL